MKIDFLVLTRFQLNFVSFCFVFPSWSHWKRKHCKNGVEKTEFINICEDKLENQQADGRGQLGFSVFWIWYFQNGKLFCTASPSSLTFEIDKYYRTKENNPLNHDDRHLGRLYTVGCYFLYLCDMYHKAFLE